MKALFALCVGLVVMLSPSVRAQDETAPAPRFTRATFEQTTEALIEGLDSKNPHILSSVAITIKELKRLYPQRSFSAFVIPLMRVVKDENGNQTARISAAVALHELRSAMGDFAISRTAQFTNDERVKHICSFLTHYRSSEKAPELSALAYPIPVDVSIYPLEEEIE